MSVVLFLAILAVLVFVHELGHFIFAKLFGIRVDEFAIGFPPKIWSMRRGETLYSINLIPFGGFVKIFGENPNEESLSGAGSTRSFIRKPRPIQALVLIAGIAFNILFAWILISASFMTGVPVSKDYAPNIPLSNAFIAVTDILPDSPAFDAGFEPGDKITRVNSASEIFSDVSAEALRSFIARHGEEELIFSVSRGDHEIKIEARPKAGIIDGKNAIGFALGEAGILKLSFGKAFLEGARMTYIVTLDTAHGIYSFLKEALFGRADLSSVTGPVGIAGMVGAAREFGFAYLLNFTAFISINLAVINLIPFPALDGGRLFIVIIEAVIRRPLNYKYVNIANAIGFGLLILLMILVSYQDIAKLL